MEIANQNVTVRIAAEKDTSTLTELLRRASYTHMHVDWRMPGDWLGTPCFAVAETTADHGQGAGRLVACFAVGADPPPAAWVRVAAVENNLGARVVLQALQDAVLPAAEAYGVTHIGFLPLHQWPMQWVRALGYQQIDEVVTYVKSGLTIPDESRYNRAVKIRSVRAEDLPRLVRIEEEAFSPLWRHSEEGLRLGWKNALCFDVAELGGHLVGFQYSAASDNQDSGHLVRLTVSPDAQGAGVGGALLASALQHYKELHFQGASLNTQASNVASRRLYERFGFVRIDYAWPVWCLYL
jgi:ribosomal protein S18 acetylase RimI-like enzyme